MTTLLLAVPLLAASAAAAPVSDAFERDRAAILAMAGRYQVSFNFNETVPLRAGYTLAEAQRSQGVELVLVIEDTGRVVELQHLLVVGDGKRVVKHWRQRWEFEPSELLEFRGSGHFTRRSVAPAEARGAWSQSVFEVDEAPRYQSLGRWRHAEGASSWESGETWRPLPRREYTKRSDYQALQCRNRHTLTPEGWVHEQDNTKLILTPGATQALVREAGLNHYRRAPERDLSAAATYWRATSAFWRDVREAWRAATSPASVSIDDRDRDGEARTTRLLALADELAAGGPAPERTRLTALVGSFVHPAPASAAIARR